MGFIVLLIVGGIVGWIASIIMKTNAQQGLLLNVVVGIVGSFVAGLVITPILKIAPIGAGISFGSIVVSLLGAIVLLAIVNLIRRGTVR